MLDLSPVSQRWRDAAEDCSGVVVSWFLSIPATDTVYFGDQSARDSLTYSHIGIQAAAKTCHLTMTLGQPVLAQSLERQGSHQSIHEDTGRNEQGKAVINPLTSGS